MQNTVMTIPIKKRTKADKRASLFILNGERKNKGSRERGKI